MSLSPLRIEQDLRSSKMAFDDATMEMIRRAETMGIDTIFTRQARYDETLAGVGKARCQFGLLGFCCRQCAMGPCRILPKISKGTCGANKDTIIARNLLMMVARGTASHATHARHAASILLKTAQKKTSYEIKDIDKLNSIAEKINIDTSGGVENTAIQAANMAFSDIVSNKESMEFFTSYCPENVNSNLFEKGVIPGSVGNELLNEGLESSMGTMSDPTHFILQAIRLGLADITSLIISSEFHDVLFGIPKPYLSKIGFNVLDKNRVNVVIHGHVPMLSEKIVEISESEEIQKKARDIGAEGLNIVGVCCTGNEVLMRHGVPLAGSNVQQELIILTGLVEAFVVDEQCIFPNVENVADKFHTKLITTMDTRFPNAEHVQFKEEEADEVAKDILIRAIENFPNRGKNIYLPRVEPKELLAGFSVETCIDVLSKLDAEDPLKPLIDNIASGNIYGVVLLAGCTSPKVMAEASHVTIAKELMKHNVLVLATGCAAQSCARAGFLVPEATERYSGEKIKDVLRVLGDAADLGGPMPPVWHFGSCVDNSRAIVLLSALAERMGVLIKDLPVAASAAEWVAEKAAAIGTGAMALGVTVHLGVTPPVIGSPTVASLITKGSEDLFGGKFIIEIDPVNASERILNHIKEKRKNLGLDVQVEILQEDRGLIDTEQEHIQVDTNP